LLEALRLRVQGMDVERLDTAGSPILLAALLELAATKVTCLHFSNKTKAISIYAFPRSPRLCSLAHRQGSGSTDTDKPPGKGQLSFEIFADTHPMAQSPRRRTGSGTAGKAEG
jgi:hypothetical protein